MHLIHVYLISYVSSMLLAVGLTPLAIRAGTMFGLLDSPGLRKVHRIPIPRIGGLAIALATVIPIALVASLVPMRLTNARGDISQVMALMAAGLALTILGFLDDAYNIPAKFKLLVLLLAGLAFCLFGGVIRSFTAGGQEILQLQTLSWPVTLIWLAGVTVSVNFIDGLDGLAAGVVAIAGGVLAIGAASQGHPLVLLFVLSLLGALCGFLIFNVYPARIFMGDCGSMFIGFMLAGACVMSNHAIGSTRALLLPGLALSIPFLDTFFTMVRRGLLQRRSLFAAERGHIHHRLLDSGLWHPHVVLLLHAVTLAAAGVGIACIFIGHWAAILAAIVFAAILLTLFWMAGSMRTRETVSAFRRNRAAARENHAHRAIFYDMQLAFEEIDTFDQWWEQVMRAAESLGLLKLNMLVCCRDGRKRALRWSVADEPVARVDSITAEIPVAQRRAGESLRLEVELACSQFPESTSHRLSLFSQLVGDHGIDTLPDRPRTNAQKRITPPKRDGQTSTGDLAALASAPETRAPGAFPTLRVAIVHDFLYTYAGAERVLEQLIEIFPQADLFSLFDFLPENARGFIQNKRVQTTFLQRMPFAKSRHRLYLPLMPVAIEQFDFSGYDLVLSSSYVAAKGVLTRSDQLHICYCHTPARYAWDMQKTYLGQAGMVRGLKSVCARSILHYIRNWDVHSAHGVDLFLTNSDYVGRRIQKLYRRESTTIHPPVDTDYFTLHEQKEDYYVTASRMVPYKRIDLIVEAFAKMPNRRLIVVGDGPEMPKIRALAGPNIRFVGHETAERLRRHIQLAKAFIFAAEEDFGIAPVEAMACGTPVIAFNRGGVIESVIDQQTGLFFNEQTPEDIIDAVERFEEFNWNPREIRKHAEQFSSRHFRERITQFARRNVGRFQAAKMLPRQALGVPSSKNDSRRPSLAARPSFDEGANGLTHEDIEVELT